MLESVHLLGTGRGPIGILSRPPENVPVQETGIVLMNSGLLHRVGPFGMYVQLARELAKQGFVTLRIDQSGKGDSERRDQLGFEESMLLDFDDAAKFLTQEAGVKQFVVMGLCSGADDALLLATRVEAIRGAALLEAFAFRTPRYFLLHYVPRLFRARLYWIAFKRLIRSILEVAMRPFQTKIGSIADIGAIREFSGDAAIRRRYKAACEQKVKLLCIFTDGSRSYYNYEGQLHESLGLDRNQSGITERYLPGAKHTYPIVSDRKQAIAEIVVWLKAEFLSPDLNSSLDDRSEQPTVE